MLETEKAAKADTKYVYGAKCLWHGSIHEVGTLDSSPYVGTKGLPCCPKCKGVLYQKESKEEWDTDVKVFMMIHPTYTHYKEWVESLRTRENCRIPCNWDWTKDYEEFVAKLGESKDA